MGKRDANDDGCPPRDWPNRRPLVDPGFWRGIMFASGITLVGFGLAWLVIL